MNNSIRRVGLLGALFTLFATFMGEATAAEVPDLSKLKQAAIESGKVALGQFELFQSSYLADVTIQGPKFSEDGSISGTTTLAGRDARVVLQYIEANEGIGRWVLAMMLPTERLGELAPAVHGSITDQLQLATPILVFAKQAARLRSRDLAPEVRSFYQQVYDSPTFEVHLEPGVNLLTAASAQADIQAGATTLGLNLDKLVLEGVILKNFDAEQLKEAKQNGRLLKAMGREAELRARLRDAKVEGLPKDFVVSELALLVTGEPVVGLQFKLAVGADSDRREFRCRSKFLVASKQNGGRQGVSISARSDVEQPWRNALGIAGLEMRQLTLEIRYERIKAGPPAASIGVSGELKFGDKFVEVSGGLQSRRGVTIGFFKGSINSLDRDDLVAVVNDLHATVPGQRRELIDGSLLPDFELRKVVFNYAPLGGSAELGIESGIGLSGELYLFGSKVAQADVLADATQPLISIRANVNRFDMGEIALNDCELDVRMAGDADSYFRFKGGARVLDIEASATAELGVRTSVVELSGKLAKSFEVDVLFRTPTLANPTWEFDAVFKNDFSRTLGTTVAADLRKWGEQTKAEYNEAQADLDRALRDVNRLNAEIATTRAQVLAERAKHQAAVERAQSDVRKIDGDVKTMRARVEAERKKLLDGIARAKREVAKIQQDIDGRRNEVKAERARDLSVHKRDRDNAKKSYDSAQKAFKSAESAWRKEKNPFKKVKLGVVKDAKGVARDAKRVIYDGANKKYSIAKAAMDRIPVDADPKIVALKAAKGAADGALSQADRAYRKATGGVSVDADPRVAGLLAAKGTGLAALATAEKTLEISRRIPVDADPRLIGLFAARDTATVALQGAKAAVSAVDDTVQVATEILARSAEGKIIDVVSVRLSGRLGDFAKGNKVALEARVRLLDKPEVLRVSISSKQLESGDVFDRIADAILPKLKAQR